MAQSIISSPIKDIWPDGDSPITLSTTPGYLWRDSDAQEVEFFCDVDFRLNISPRIKYALFFDDTAETYTDGANELQDGDTDTALTISSMTSSDYIYVITDDPILGFYIDVDKPNGTASTMTVSYYNGTEFTDASDTDGTADGGKTFAQDGLVYWAAKTDEAQTSINGHTGYIYRIGVSATMDSEVTLLQMLSLSKRSDTHAPSVSREGATYHSFSMNIEEVGGFQLDVSSGSGTLVVNWIKH